MPAGDPPLTLQDLHNLSAGRLRNSAPSAFPGLAKAGIHTVLDLLQHYPRRYLDRTQRLDIDQLSMGQLSLDTSTSPTNTNRNKNTSNRTSEHKQETVKEVYVVGEVVNLQRRRTRRKRFSVVSMWLRETIGIIELVFFNQSWIAKQYKTGDTVVAFGKISRFRDRYQMKSPTIDRWGDMAGRIMPVYPGLTNTGLRSFEFARFVDNALNRCTARGIADPVPTKVLKRLGLLSRQRALNGIHRPETHKDYRQARRRLVFDELLRMQVELVRRQRRLRATTSGVSHVINGELTRGFYSNLPFELTDTQKQVIEEISDDLAQPWPMHRLLQGDVGSGKTVVALHALLTAVQGGFQGVLMAPTEILAEQHMATIRSLVDGLEIPDQTRLSGKRPLRVDLLTSQTSKTLRRDIIASLTTGAVDIVVGTHALISENVEYKALAVAVVDEQHRFGVEQRSQLRDKSSNSAIVKTVAATSETKTAPPGTIPAATTATASTLAFGTIPDMLVMTATPIPRTAAMTVYGDLEVSILDELPAGRQAITTLRAPTPEHENQVWQEVRRAVAKGRQAYVVCPLIEDSTALAVRSATELYDYLTEPDSPLHDLRIGLLHGRVAPAEKQQTMELFYCGQFDLLVTTTVIEVGVDVPNATVMVVVDAHRFGIAQLHQLRGRVGRGSHASVCYLLGSSTSEEGEARLNAVAETTDGFKLAEVDLDLRGEGTIMGAQQKGRSDLRLASLRHHKHWIKKAREIATDLVSPNGTLEKYQMIADEVEFIFENNPAADFLLKS
ncbi:MAG: ATP-dependent DNA helicase RecG [Acidimicrobiaceae bacterium]|nr:ATP-dependent DNA helicase RecG [Acidimicrobiaceae bacterium]